MGKLADRLSRIKPSATLAVIQRAQELRSQGVDVVSFSAGEPDFDTPAHIVESGKAALDKGMTRYTPVAGIPDLRRAIAAESAEARRVPCTSDNVIVSTGAKQSIFNFFLSVLNPGDEVIVPAPYWVSYPDQVLLADAEPVIVETTSDNGFVLTPKALANALTSKTKALVLNTPSNPTGAVYPAEAVKDLAMAAVEAGLYILSDEIYRDLIYGDAKHTSPLSVVDEDKRNRIFVIDGVSKTYAMTGWRIGWGIGDPDIIKGMSKIQGQSTSNANSIAQAATLTAITSPKNFLKDWTGQYKARRDVMVRLVNAMDGVKCATPDGAFYVLASVKGVLERMGKGADDIKLAAHLLEKARIAVVPGSPFGAPGHIRFSYATSLELINEGLSRMDEALKKI